MDQMKGKILHRNILKLNTGARADNSQSGMNQEEKF